MLHPFLFRELNNRWRPGGQLIAGILRYSSAIFQEAVDSLKIWLVL